MSAAMLPPAPGLFSTTTDWPQTSCRRLPTRRAVMSVEPPGVNGTTTRTGFTGQLVLKARDERMDGAAMAAASPTKRRRFNMAPLPRKGDRPIASGRRIGPSLKATPAKINAAALLPKADIRRRCLHVREIHITESEKNGLTRWKTDPRKASANKAGGRVGRRNGIRPPDCVAGS